MAWDMLNHPKKVSLQLLEDKGTLAHASFARQEQKGQEARSAGVTTKGIQKRNIRPK